MECLRRAVFTFLVVGIGLLAPATSAIAESVEASIGTIQPTFAEQAPLLDEPPVPTAAQRALLEQTLKETRLPVPIPVATSSEGRTECSLRYSCKAFS